MNIFGIPCVVNDELTTGEIILAPLTNELAERVFREWAMIGKYHPDGPKGWAKVMAEMDAFDQTNVNLVEWAWAIIANAGGGDWTRESADWQDAAARWREEYHKWLERFKEMIADAESSSAKGSTATNSSSRETTRS